MLVIDASAATAACARADGFKDLGEDLVAPPLMWSEVRANLHLQAFKGTISYDRADVLHDRLCAAAIRSENPAGLGPWRAVDRLQEPDRCCPLGVASRWRGAHRQLPRDSGWGWPCERAGSA
jgi:hypothetical protein